MHFLLMIAADETVVPNLPAEEIYSIIEAVQSFDEKITDAGQNVGSIRLQPVATAKTIRFRGGKAMTTDGPFAESKEQLGGIYIIEAEDLDEALRIASQLPMTSYGMVEVRPVLGLDLRREAFVQYDPREM